MLKFEKHILAFSFRILYSMLSIGLLLGAIIGFKTGGLWGLIFGSVVGSIAQTWIAENVLGLPSKTQRIQQSYFKALFLSIGKLAKIDGIVTKDEIRKCENVMRKMNLNTQQRQQAIKYFNQGKRTGFDLFPVIQQFARVLGYSFSVKQMFMEMLLEVASANNKINKAEWDLLIRVCEHLNFPQQLFIAIVKMRGFDIYGHRYESSSQQRQHQYQRQHYQQPQSRSSGVNSYVILGVKETDSKMVIRKAYKKLMSQHHPDKLIAKGLPPEMIEIAKTKTQNIQAAWEDIKQQRGF